MVNVSRDLENSNTNGDGKIGVGNKLAEWRKRVPSRRLEFESYCNAIGDELKQSIPADKLKEIEDKGLDVIKYLAVRKLAEIMFPAKGDDGYTYQKNKLSLDAMEMMFSRLYPKMQSMEIIAEVNHRHHLQVPESNMDEFLNKLDEHERKRFAKPAD